MVSHVHLIINSLPRNLPVIITIKGQSPTEHQVNNNPQAPQIDTLVIRSLQKNLRCHIAESSERLLASFSWTKGLRESEVN